MKYYEAQSMLYDALKNQKSIRVKKLRHILQAMNVPLNPDLTTSQREKHNAKRKKRRNTNGERSKSTR